MIFIDEEFVKVKKKLHDNFEDMVRDAKCLFEVDHEKSEMKRIYLDSFPEGTNELFETNREHECTACIGFINTAGSVVTIKNGKKRSIWDLDTGSEKYQPVFDAMRDYVLSRPVASVWISKETTIGKSAAERFDAFKPTSLRFGKVYEFNHWTFDVPEKFILPKDKIPEVRGRLNDCKNSLKIAVETTRIEDIDMTLSHIAKNEVPRGEVEKPKLEKLKTVILRYNQIADSEEKNAFLWENAIHYSLTKRKLVPTMIAGIHGSNIDNLLSHIKDYGWNGALKAYKESSAGENYGVTTRAASAQQTEEAIEFIEENEYTEPVVNRGYAHYEDVPVTDVLFANEDAVKRMPKNTDALERLRAKKSKAVKTDKATEISAEKFLTDVLPNASSIEALVENSHVGNFVAITTSIDREAKSIFDWNTNKAHVYTGNVASPMTETARRVKELGGNIEGDLRFSIRWNDCKTDNTDIDAHCTEPNRHEIEWRNAGIVSALGGVLDVDIRVPNSDSRCKDGIAVENIIYENRKTMKDGEYKFYVDPFSWTYGGTSFAKKGFRAEIAFDDKIYSYNYSKPFKTQVTVAIVTLKNGKFIIKHGTSAGLEVLDKNAPVGNDSVEAWGVNTNNFIPVSMICYSPNYWTSVENPTGTKHLMFMLKGCKTEENLKGIFSEFLNSDLKPYSRVINDLTEDVKLVYDEDQIAGLGFPMSGIRNHLVVKVDGTMYKIMF